MDRENGIPSDEIEFAIFIVRKTFMLRLKLTEEDLSKLDPYNWAGHVERYSLWIIRNYIELVEPKDPKERSSLLVHGGNFTERAKSTFRYLDENNVSAFKQHMNNLEFKVNQMPPREGPWSSKRIRS